MSVAYYEENVASATANIKALESKINKNSFLRLGVMILGGIILFKLFDTNNIILVMGTIILVVVIFLFLVFRQSKIERKLQEARIFLRINENELNIMNRKGNMYEHGEEYNDGAHPYASDLDVFGANSLFAMVNRCSSKDGVNVLKDWFSHAATKEEILARQQAVNELREDPAHLQTFQTKMMFNLGSKVNLRAYIASFFNDKKLNFGNKWLAFYVEASPNIFFFGLAFSQFYYNIVPYLLILAVVHLLWTLSQAGKISQFSNKIDKLGASLLGLADAIKLIEDKKYTSKLNLEIQQQIKVKGSEKKLSTIIAELGKLIDKLDARNNMFVGAILNMLFLWDFKQVMAINKWKEQYQDSILQGFEAISAYEALVSLAILSKNNPDWVQPEILDHVRFDKIKAEELNHPLIIKERAVANDYNAQSHDIALITGSNMAGKSTFLRTVGINAVLAYAGAVVNAKLFSLPIYHLLTYMRIKDSLNESTSTFKAELDRMKFILDQVEQDKSSFFLIDEMLRGTNSVDKYLGSKAIIKKLIGLDGRGMLATHDLQLAELAEQFPERIKNYHFDIQVQGSEMLFDYKLKHGPCTIFNASLLLKGIGVVVESEKVA